MEPTQPAASTPTLAREPLVEFIRTQRQNAAMILGVLAVIFLAVGVFLAQRALRTPTAPTPDKPLSGAKTDPDKPPELPKAPGEIENLKRGDYTVGWVACLTGFLFTAMGALWLLARLPESSESRQRTEARLLVLGVGEGLGLGLMLTGLMLLYRWNESLSKWLETNETQELRWVLVPIMMVVTGIGIVLAAIQPARAEERNNAMIRRLVYGSNFALTCLLLVVAFVVFNVVAAVKVPNMLDATETGFYEISDRTKQLLGDLKEPITAYFVTAEESRASGEDMRQLLLAYQDRAGGRFKLKFVDVVANRREYETLRAKYPNLELALAQRNVSGAVLLTVGEDEKRHAVIPDTEFVAAQGGKPVFQGEARLFRELVILADTDTKPIVYFTQANGEMRIDPAAEAPDDQKMTRFRSYLEKNYLEVRALNFTLDNPTVPADASVLVVADPRIPFSPAAAGAIKKYMTDPAKKGRLVLLAGIVPGPNNQGVMKTGLEEVLAELNVQLGDKFVYTFPLEQRSHPLKTIAKFTGASLRAKNEVALTIAKAAPAFVVVLPREVSPLGANPAFQATTLFESLGVTWLEDDRIPEGRLQAVVSQITRDERFAVSRKLSESERPLGVLVTSSSAPPHPGAPPTPGTPVAAVYGNAFFVSDEIAKHSPADSAPITFDLIGVTIDYLRGRPSIAASTLEGKPYAEYKYPEKSTVDTTRVMYLPLVLSFLIVVGLGTGVWFIRRK